MTDVPARLALPTPHGARMAVMLARLCGLLACVLGIAVILGWRFDLPTLRHFEPGFVTMKPNAAFGMAVAGLALFCFTVKLLRPLGRLLALVPAAIGAVTLLEDALGIDLHVDQVLFSDLPLNPITLDPGHMAPPTSASLLLFGVALLCARGPRAWSALSQIFGMIILVQVLIVLTGYAYGVTALHFPGPFMAMSLYSAMGALLLGVGLLSATPEYGLTAAIIEPSPAGEMLRRLLPGIVVLPLLIGFVAHKAELASYYNSAATSAIFAIASIVVLALFAWTTIGAIRRADRDRNLALMELRGQREWLSTALGSIADGVIATDPAGSVLLLNRVAEQLTGWSPAEARGRPIWEVFRIIDEATRKPIDDPALKALREGKVTRPESGALLLTRDNKELPVEDSGAPILGADGSLVGAVLIFRDVTERRRTAQRQSMLVGELNHRVKNALAIVQSLVQASLRQATTPQAQMMAETLAERLRALHRAHDLLLESQWSGASLKAMVERELEPYRRGDGPRITIKGPDVLLPPQCTSILAMTLHELATNAVKYGALSSNTGQLAVSWKMGRGSRLLLTWEERGVHIPAEKRSTGFGTQLIDKGIRHNLGGETKLEFRPTGLYVQMNVPLEPSNEPRAIAAPVHAPAQPA